MVKNFLEEGWGDSAEKGADELGGYTVGEKVKVSHMGSEVFIVERLYMGQNDKEYAVVSSESDVEKRENLPLVMLAKIEKEDIE